MKTLVLFQLFVCIPFLAISQAGIFDHRVDSLLSLMTLEEKVGQMTQAERGPVESSGKEDIRTWYLGSVLSGGGSTPDPNTVDSWAEMYDAMQEKATSTRLGIPILYGTDAVHGHNNLKGSVIFPHNIGLGCTRDPDLVREIARITALEVRATGPDWTFSPCVAVPQNEFWGRTYEGFSESPELTAEMAEAAVLGYQSDSLGTKHHILACAKHFVGDGGTLNGIDQGNTILSEELLRAIHVPPYTPAINAGVGSVMISFSSWNGNKCHGHKGLITGLLKEELGFEGIVISDWKGIDQLHPDFKTAVKMAINAGIDMAMQPDNYVQFIQALTQLVDEGQVSMERIDDAVSRILKVKMQLGLFEDHTANPGLKDTVGCPAHREIAVEAVRKSLVLLKNDGLLPFSKSPAKVLVAGSKSKDIGSMCGGWTISWQGATGGITEGTTVFEAIGQMVGTEKVVYTATASQVPDADYAIVVVGEEPYAEGAGDVFPVGPSGFTLSAEESGLVKAIRNKGIPMAVILFSGRPLDIRDELNLSDAFIVAWLPGSEGGTGIADVLFGNYAPVGKLSHTWPESFSDVPINITVNNPGKEELFPFGYGLTFPLGLNDRPEQSIAVKIYPNPVKTQFQVDLTGQPGQEFRIDLFDLNGRMLQHLYAGQSVAGKHTIHLTLDAGLPDGLYLIRVTGQGTTYVARLVKGSGVFGYQ